MKIWDSVYIYRSVDLEDCTISSKLKNTSTDHVPIMIAITDAKTRTVNVNKIQKRSMKNFSPSYWNETLATFNFCTQAESETKDINILATEFANTINDALDICAPKKTILQLSFSCGH